MLTKDMAARLPDSPGVYFFHDRTELLYIGKAKRLRRRVLQYTSSSRKPRRIHELVRRTNRVEVERLGSELEALLLESRLIKELQPPYNVKQKQLRGHPFIRVMREERFPRLTVTSKIENDGCEYFGPFPSFVAAEEALALVHQVFPLRSCLLQITPSPTMRPCLDWHIGRCDAPCAGHISDEAYGEIVERACAFLGGGHEALARELLADRDEACFRLEFERARKVQNRLDALVRYASRKRYQVNAVRNSHLVVVCPALRDDEAELFFVRSGELDRQVRVERRIGDAALVDLFGEAFLTPRKRREYTLYDVDAMNVTSQWLFANRNRQDIVAIERLDPECCTDALSRVRSLLREPLQMEFPELARVPYAV
ncbi:hypothetical protein FJZ36_10980 [Candidatus Poribacteria bacterium]|nr:hypothetical protein [Candidatus Poribacteria bacterium]